MGIKDLTENIRIIQKAPETMSRIAVISLAALAIATIALIVAGMGVRRAN